MDMRRIDVSVLLIDVLGPVFVLMALAYVTILLGWPTANSGMWPDHPDRAIWMDAAWRVAQGQIPHLDFVTPIGSAWLYVNSLPVRLLGPQYSALPYGVAIVMVICGLVLWHILRPIAGRFYAVLGLLYVHKIFFHAQFLDYNEIALFILTLVIITSVSLRPARGAMMGAYCGAAVAALFFWKINFFVAALAVTGIAILVYPRTARWYIGFGIGLVAIAVVCGAAIHWHFDLMLQQYDIPAAIKGRRAALDALSLRQQGVVTFHFILYVIACAVLLWLGDRFKPTSRFAWMSDRKFVVAFFLLLLGIQNALCLTNASVWAPHMVPWLIFIVAIWAAETNGEEPPPDWISARRKVQIRYISAAVMLVFWASTAIPRLMAAPHMLAIEARKLNMNDTSYEVSVADGIRLLRGDRMGHLSVFTLGYANPFPALLKSPSPGNTPLWWSIYDSINVKNPPVPRTVMADVDVVMEPIWHLDRFRTTQAEYMKQLLGGYIAENYSLVARDRFWKVWLKKTETKALNANGWRRDG